MIENFIVIILRFKHDFLLRLCYYILRDLFISLVISVNIFFCRKQILTCSQQSKEMTRIEHDNLARRIQEYRTQEELDSLRSPRSTAGQANGDGIHIVGVNSYKSIEALMLSSAKGEVIQNFYMT